MTLHAVTIHSITWETTPKQLREIADKMQQKMQTAEAGDDKIIFTARSDGQELRIMFDQDKLWEVQLNELGQPKFKVGEQVELTAGKHYDYLQANPMDLHSINKWTVIGVFNAAGVWLYWLNWSLGLGLETVQEDQIQPHSDVATSVPLKGRE